MVQYIYPMEIVRELAIEELANYFQRVSPNVKLKIEGKPFLFNERTWLLPVARELITNCAEAGAKSVEATIENGRLTVEDDVVHDNPDATLVNLNSYVPISTKNRCAGGEGIWNTRQTLERHNGKLNYQANDEGKIIAVATWEE